jgi:hypothetical protein
MQHGVLLLFQITQQLQVQLAQDHQGFEGPFVCARQLCRA